MKRLWRLLGALLVIGTAVWGALAIWFTVPASFAIRVALALVFVALAALGLFTARRQKRLIMSFGAAFAGLLVWWLTIAPSNDRAWPPDVATLSSAETKGNIVTLRNIRNFNYRSATDYSPRWYDKTVDLRQLNTLDLIAVYWMGDAIAHTMLSFGFAGEQITVSIETRKEQSEAYSTLAGFFRRYELYYVVRDERDLIGLRTTHRNSTEDVYLYRVNAPKTNIRRLFLEYLEKINTLQESPEFYNTAVTNCTTNIVMHIRAFQKRVPVSWKILLSGYFPQLVYERGGLDQELAFDDLRRKGLINERARNADGAADFSHRIRVGLPGTR